MITELTITCVGRDREGRPTHEHTVVAHLGLDEQAGVVLMPTTQQRGNPQAGRPRAFGLDLDCLVCGDRARVGKPPHRRLRRVMRQCQATGIRELPLQALHAQMHA
jgi:hypothetical protein